MHEDMIKKKLTKSHLGYLSGDIFKVMSKNMLNLSFETKINCQIDYPTWSWEGDID